MCLDQTISIFMSFTNGLLRQLTYLYVPILVWGKYFVLYCFFLTWKEGTKSWQNSHVFKPTFFTIFHAQQHQTSKIWYSLYDICYMRIMCHIAHSIPGISSPLKIVHQKNMWLCPTETCHDFGEGNVKFSVILHIDHNNFGLYIIYINHIS